MKFVDWDTGQTFLGKLVPRFHDGFERVLQFFREGEVEDGFILDRRKTGSIAILEASGDELASLLEAGYLLSID
jgi:hypothetical protein